MIFVLATQLHVYLPWVNVFLAQCLNSVKALVGAFNQEKALVGAFSVIVQPVVEPMDRFAALLRNAVANNSYFCLSWVGWVDINIPRCLPRSLSNQGQWIKLCLLSRIHWIQYSMSSLMWTLGRCWDQSHRQTRGFLNTNWFSNLSPWSSARCP